MRFTVSKRIFAGGSELQDCAEIFETNSHLILILADGAGGLSGGAKAAEFVVQSVKKQIDSVGDNSEQLCTMLKAVDREMFANGNFGETTAVVISLSENDIVGASVGDSGALIFSKNGVDDLTRRQIRKPLLGSGNAFPVGFNRNQLDGVLLLASDGLLKYASQEKIAATITASDLEAAANKLIDLVRYQSGALPDDVSVLLARQI